MRLSHYGAVLVAVSWVLQSLAIIIVALRMYARIYLAKAAGRDDWTMVVGLILAVSFTCMSTAAAFSGTGRHFDDLARKHPKELPHVLLINTVAQALALHSFDISKLSIAFLLVRIFNPRAWIRAIFYFLSAALIALCVASTFIIFLQCDPVNDQWTPSQPVSQCWSPNVYADLGYATGAIAAALDLIFAIYPGIVCWKLHMSVSKRIGLACLFGVGFVAAAFTIYKTTLLVTLNHVSDITYDIAKIFLWTNVEANVVIIAGSIPTINPVIRLLCRGKASSQADLGPKGKRKAYYKLSGNTAVQTPETASIRKDIYGLPLTPGDEEEAGVAGQLRPTASPFGEGITRTVDVSVSRESADTADGEKRNSALDAIPDFLAEEKIPKKG